MIKRICEILLYRAYSRGNNQARICANQWKLTMRTDVKRLLKLFNTTGFKNGDLVLTAEIYRVTDKDWGKKNWDHGVEVVTVYPQYICPHNSPECRATHIMQTRKGGQSNIMKLKDFVRYEQL